MVLTNEEIVERYKSSTNKLREMDSIIADTGIEPKDLFLILLETHCIDGRLVRQGRYKDDWVAAKREMRDRGKKESNEAVISMNGLKKENADLKRAVTKLENEINTLKLNSGAASENEVPESYQKTIDTLNKEIEHLQEKNAEYIEKIQELHKKAEITPETKGETVQEVMDQCTIESLSEAVERLEEEKESLKGVIEIKDKSIQELLTENANLKNSLHNREDDIFEFKGKLESAMDLVKTREEKIEELEKKIKHLKTSDFNSTIDGMVSESKLSTANERIKELEKELSFYEDEKDGDGALIDDLKTQNEILKSKLSTCEQYILDLMVYTEV